jgi:RNA polymerase sigma-70 factor (ECF subfamily)
MNSLQHLQQSRLAVEPKGLGRVGGAIIYSFPRGLRLKSTTPDQSAPTEATNNNADMVVLVARISEQRDRDAFQQLYKYFAPRVKSFLKARGLADQAADDVLQIAMLSVWEKAHSYKAEKAAVSTWVFTIARYKYIDSLRHSGRQATEMATQGDELDMRPSDAPVADDGVFDDQRKVAVQEAIAQLPAEQQSVIYLSFIKGLAHSEIAEQLGLPLGTVKSRIRRAFERLRKELEEVKDLGQEL